MLRSCRALVTGGANGIGAATVRAFVLEGARVVSVDIDDERGGKVAAEAGEAASFLHCDCRDRGEVDRVFAAAAGALGGLDVVVNTAGIEAAMAAEEITDEEWDRVFDIHAKGTLYTNQAAFRHLREGGGRIINFGSGAGVRGQRGSAHYSAAKAAVMGWTRTVAQEWGRYGITVNAVVPAAWTGQYEDHRARMSPEDLAAHDAMMQRTVPLGGRLGDADRDIAPVVVFLASEASHFMTGQTVSVDGGMVLLGS
jgi:NAD(P)-dependent dehydrogenase (short-subunit alcohol dehydrogenase family)